MEGALEERAAAGRVHAAAMDGAAGEGDGAVDGAGGGAADGAGGGGTAARVEGGGEAANGARGGVAAASDDAGHPGCVCCHADGALSDETLSAAAKAAKLNAAAVRRDLYYTMHTPSVCPPGDDDRACALCPSRTRVHLLHRSLVPAPVPTLWQAHFGAETATAAAAGEHSEAGGLRRERARGARA